MKIKNLFKSAKLAGLAGLVSLAMTFNPKCSAVQAFEYPQSRGNATKQVEESRISEYIHKNKLSLSDYKPERQGDFYFLGGQGMASPGGNTKYSFEIGLREQITKNFSLGIEHINEGHPDINTAGHRDGFALMGWYQMPISRKLQFEAGAGPYFSMNTTWRDNPEKEYNDKNLGVLAALALVYPINTSMNLRVQFDNTLMPGSFSTQALNIGLGINLGEKSYAKEFQTTDQDKKNLLSFMTGPSKTTRAGGELSQGFKVEFQREISDRFAYSISGISEGDSGLSSRKGVAGQAWFRAPKIGRLEFSAGLGPYIAQENNPENKGIKLFGITSLGLKVDITEEWVGIAEFSRVISSYDKDQDMFLLGVGKKF